MTTTVPFREIVVPLDLVAPCDAVLRLASTLATRAGVGVRLVTVSSPGLDHTAEKVDLHAYASKLDAPAVAVDVIESNDVVPLLLDAAGAHGLVMIKTRARGPLAAVLLGSTADALLRATTRPVLLVGPSTGGGAALDVMEVCLDTARAAETLVPVAGEWARGLGLRLRFVHAHVEGRGPSQRDADALVADAAGEAADLFGVVAEGAVLPARFAPEAIVADAATAGAAIVAVGRRPLRTGVRRALGSMAAAVAHTTSAAVLTVPLHTEGWPG